MSNQSQVVAKAKFVKVSPKKVSRIAKLIRGKQAKDAQDVLRLLPHRAAFLLKKVLDSAVANAVHNDKITEDSLFVSEILVNEGPRLKRFQARARGRVFQILKRTSHIVVGLGSQQGAK